VANIFHSNPLPDLSFSGKKGVRGFLLRITLPPSVVEDASKLHRTERKIDLLVNTCETNPRITSIPLLSFTLYSISLPFQQNG
jgi:hypothetical protein